MYLISRIATKTRIVPIELHQTFKPPRWRDRQDSASIIIIIIALLSLWSAAVVDHLEEPPDHIFRGEMATEIVNAAFEASHENYTSDKIRPTDPTRWQKPTFM